MKKIIMKKLTDKQMTILEDDGWYLESETPFKMTKIEGFGFEQEINSIKDALERIKYIKIRNKNAN